MPRYRALLLLALVVGTSGACGNATNRAGTNTPLTTLSSEAAVATDTPLPTAIRVVPLTVDPRTAIAEQQRNFEATQTVLAETTGIYRYDLASQTLTRVSTARAHGLAWLPDGRSMWYTTTLHPNSKGEIRSLDLRTHEDSLVYSVDGGWVVLAPASRRAVFSRFRHGEAVPGYSVIIFDEASGERDIDEGSHLALSSDGSMLSYVSPSCGGTPLLKIVDLTRGLPVPIPDIAVGRTWWLPDARIALSLGGATSVENLQWRILDIRAGAMTSLRDLVGDSVFSEVAFSPDMEHVVLTLDTPGGHVVVRNIGTGVETGVAVEPGFGVFWAPDSRHVAFDARDSLVITTSDGAVIDTVKLPASDRNGYYAHVEWSPDSASVAFTLSEEGGVGVCD